MAHAHHTQTPGLPTAPAPGHHASAEDEYLFQPPDSAHEHSDTNVWIIVKFGLWLAISAIVIHVGLGFLFGLFVNQSEETIPQFPLAVGQGQRLPVAPRLQRFPVNEFYEFHQQEDAILKNYGWVNKEAGVVRLPISEAMRLTIERGLPVRAPAGEAPQQTQTLGLMPADSSAGRTMERRRQ